MDQPRLAHGLDQIAAVENRRNGSQLMTIVKETTVNLALAYYQAVGNKNAGAVAEFLHPDVRLIGPLGEHAGKEAVLKAVTNFATLLKRLRVCASFGSSDQAMVNYEVDFGEPFGICRSAALITFQENQIARLELFFDARPFEKNTA
jgi:SnoaL-like protein